MAVLSRNNWIGIILICLTNICGFLLAVEASGQRNYLLEFTKVDANHNSSHIQAFDFSLRNDSNRRVLDGRLELATTLQEFKIRVTMHTFRKGMPRITPIDLTLNGCEILDTISTIKVLQVALKTIKRYINVMPSCPFRKDFNYTLTGLYINEEDFPTYMPENEFILNYYVMHQNELIAKLILNGRVVYVKK